MKRLLALAAVLAGCLVAAVFGAAPAVAHPTLASSDPADGARLATAPARVTVPFTEDV